jgi:hypothetical protein
MPGLTSRGWYRVLQTARPIVAGFLAAAYIFWVVLMALELVTGSDLAGSLACGVVVALLAYDPTTPAGKRRAKAGRALLTGTVLAAVTYFL